MSQRAVPGAANQLVYPRNPPQSPHLALVGILIAGLPQILFGQVAKGVSILAGAIVLGILSAAVLWYVLAIVSVVDGYQIGNKLHKGQAVGKWEFF